MQQPIIEVDGLGVEFYRARRRRMSLREMVLQGRSSSPSETSAGISMSPAI